jgi:hypothetical protein
MRISEDGTFLDAFLFPRFGFGGIASNNVGFEIPELIDYQKYYFLGCGAILFDKSALTFRSTVLFPSSESHGKPRKKAASGVSDA